MHFLSHYYTEPEKNSPLFAAGLIIPDLTPGFSKIYNSVVSKMEEPLPPPLQDVHRGILRHYAGDKWFHASEAFHRSENRAMHFFIEAGLDRSRLRLSVIAHLAVEMLIDRQLVLEQPEICFEFYALVEKADEKQIENYFNTLQQPLAKQHFFHTFNFFKQKRFLLLFTELENVLFGLNKVYSLATKTVFTEEENQKFKLALHNIDLEMRYSWQEILNHK